MRHQFYKSLNQKSSPFFKDLGNFHKPTPVIRPPYKYSWERVNEWLHIREYSSWPLSVIPFFQIPEYFEMKLKDANLLKNNIKEVLQTKTQ